MSLFVHGKLGHFLQSPITEEGEDLGGSEQEEQHEEDTEDSEEEDSDGEVVVSIAGEKAPEDDDADDGKPAPQWVKDVRKENRESKKRIRELEELVRKQEAPKSAPVLGKKPAMEDDDVDWDADKFEAKLAAWFDKKREIEQHQRQEQEAADKQKAAWDGKLANYATAKTALKAGDYDDAEEVVKSEMDQTQQGIIIQVADDPALMIYALGKNPKKAKELAAIKDYATFSFQLGKLTEKLKVEKRRSAPPPEKIITGTGRVSGSSDSHLEKLRAEAERTGDNTRVLAYKREQKRKQNA
jgi:hypothetical protein